MIDINPEATHISERADVCLPARSGVILPLLLQLMAELQRA